MRILYTNNSDRTAHHYGQPVEPGDTILSLSVEDLEGVQMAVEQARITWGGLGQGSLLRRLDRPRRALTEALSRIGRRPADHTDMPHAAEDGPAVLHNETCDHANGVCASGGEAIRSEIRIPFGAAELVWEGEGGSIGDLDPRVRRVPPDGQ